jgi:hypothetical protein
MSRGAVHRRVSANLGHGRQAQVLEEEDEMNEEMAYVALCKCGGLVMATMDGPERKKETARYVAMHIKMGHEIRHVTATEVRAMHFCKNKGGCKGPNDSPELKQMELGL